MNIYANAMIDRQSYTVPEIGSGDSDLLAQYWATRTAIWTYKYPERVGSDGLERDEHDYNSSFVVLLEGQGQVIAGTRLIHAKSVALLPVGSCARVQLPGPAVEVSRFFFSPSPGTEEKYAEQQFKLFIYGIVAFLKSQGYDKAYATIRASLFEKLKQLGVPLVSNGPVQKHGGKSFIPAMMFETDQEFAIATVQNQPYRQRWAA